MGRATAKIAATIVARLANIRDISCDKRLVIDNFGHNASHAVIVNRPKLIALHTENILSKDAQPDSAGALKGVIDLIRARLPRERRAEAERLARQYYAQVDPEDLAERSSEDLYGAALSHLAFARKREPGKLRIRAINPAIDEHGWQSPHTVVEIITDDMPFLVDSVTMAVNRRGLTLHLLIHPVLRVTRKPGGELIELLEPGASEGTPESFMHVEVDRIAGDADLDALCAELAVTLADVQVAFEDWRKMHAKLDEAIADIGRRPPPIAAEDIAEAVAFLKWLVRQSFHIHRLSLP